MLDSLAEGQLFIDQQRTQLMHTIERVQKETDLKFRRIMVIETQIAGVKQEIDLLRVKRIKDETRFKEESAAQLARIARAERGVEEMRNKVAKLEAL